MTFQLEEFGSKQGDRNIDKLAGMCGLIWFFLAIDACFTWFMLDFYRYVLGAVLVLLATFLLSGNGGIVMTKQKRTILFVLLFLMCFIVLFKHRFFSFFLFVPIMCISLWRNSTLLKLYLYIRKCVLFYAILSMIIEVLVVTGLWTYLPYISILPPHNIVQESLGLENYYYLLFIIPAANHTLDLYRACGPLTEGGHFVFIVGFFYYIEKVISGKRNMLLLVCGILTFSPNFLLFVLFAEMYSYKGLRRYYLPIIKVCSILAVLVVAFVFSPDFIKDRVLQIVVKDSVEEYLAGSGKEGVISILDGRVDINGMFAYERFSNSGIFVKLLGVDDIPDSIVLSDYRWLLLYCGYFGALLFLLVSYMLSIGKEKNIYGFSIFAFVLAVLIQRAWLLNQMYIWLLVLLATAAKKSLFSRNGVSLYNVRA